MPQTAQRRSSSLPISMSDWQLDDEDFLPLSQLLVARSAPQPAVARPAQPVVRRALCLTSPTTQPTALRAPMSVFPLAVSSSQHHPTLRRRTSITRYVHSSLILPTTPCARPAVYASTVHFITKRSSLGAGTNIRAPSLLSPTGLAAEVERCTRAGRFHWSRRCVCPVSLQSREDSLHVLLAPLLPQSLLSLTGNCGLLKRNKEADDAAKIARGQCECDDRCGRLVTLESAGQFRVGSPRAVLRRPGLS